MIVATDQSFNNEIFYVLPEGRDVGPSFPHYLENSFKISFMAHAHIFSILIENEFIAFLVDGVVG